MEGSCKKPEGEGFSDGAVVKDPPCNAGDKGPVPLWGGSHMPWNNKALEPQLLSPRAETTKA